MDVGSKKCPCALLTSRRMAMVGAGLGLMTASREARSESDAARLRPQEGDQLIRADSTDMEALTPGALTVGGGPLLAMPYDPVAKVVRDGSRLNRILLLRLDPEGFDERTVPRAADGVVAYSAICPHTGCEVTNWHADTQILECPCHNSQYDPKAGAKLIAGPSPRGLAALPLRVSDGVLTVSHGFIGKLGMQQM